MLPTGGRATFSWEGPGFSIVGTPALKLEEEGSYGGAPAFLSPTKGLDEIPLLEDVPTPSHAVQFLHSFPQAGLAPITPFLHKAQPGPSFCR